VVEGTEANYAELKSRVMESLKKTFNPEFLNRLEDVSVFRPLGKPEMRQIVEIILGDFCKRLEILKRKIEFTPEAKDFLIEKGFDPELGARPLKRSIQRYLEDPLSELLLRGEAEEAHKIRVDVGEDELTFEFLTEEEASPEGEPA
jgi:ATP-dependent Clp protease ATP-binding subunit ClpC